MKLLHKLLFLFILLSGFAGAQNRNSVWCFGDSAGIDFSSGLPVNIVSSVNSRGSCASIADSTGNLKLYVAYDPSAIIAGTDPVKVYNLNHDVILNGDSLKGGGWYHEIVILPVAKNDSLYYIFYIGVTLDYGLYYAIVDMKLNGGLGAVTLKNAQLNAFPQVDCLSAVKHGNGNDWWIISRKSDFNSGGSNNDWYIYLVTADSIQAMPVQSIGAQNRTNSGRLCFSSNGDKLAFTNLINVLEIFDFDRCTGILSNTITIESDPGIAPYPYFWSCAFSPDASKLYVTSGLDTNFLYQYNLNAANIPLSKDTLSISSYPHTAGGALKLAPDNKIYLSRWYDNLLIFPYPYPDSIYNQYNMNLSVINSPDSLGSACNFQPYSFYLGGKRTYLGLPNNPDYELGPLTGSLCDTLLSVTSVPESTNFSMYPNPSSNTLYFSPAPDNSSIIKIFDASGRTLISKPFARELDISVIENGIYLVKIFSNNEIIFNKTLIKIH